MPLLPNLGDIPQAQFDQIVAAFPGATQAEKAQAYRDWLTNRIIDRVQEVKSVQANQAILASLPARPPEPGYPS